MTKHVLVADSDYFFVEFVGELLEKRGYSVTKAYDGKEAISRVQDHPYCILFVDLVMPKVDGRRFIHFVRQKYGSNHFPIVALSGVMIEQLGSLDEIGADYYMAKGPIHKLTVQLNAFMAEFETHPDFPPKVMKIMETGGVYPRRDAVELLNTLKFHQAIMESLGVGIIVVDTDACIVDVNPAASDIIGQSAIQALNLPVFDIFPASARAQLADALKQVFAMPAKTKIGFISEFKDRAVRTTVSAISLSAAQAGWVLALEDSTCV
jgi:PAS domain S-box-containing protein